MRRILGCPNKGCLNEGCSNQRCPNKGCPNQDCSKQGYSNQGCCFLAMKQNFKDCITMSEIKGKKSVLPQLLKKEKKEKSNE